MTLAHRIAQLATLTQGYSEAERKELVTKGEAMPGGRFPIVTKQDLKNALKDFNRIGQPADVKAFIVKRAKALDATDLLPADWSASTATVKQDDAGGVLSASTCPACGAEILAGVLSPETGGKKRKKAVKQEACIVQVDTVHKTMTAIVQSPDLPHVVQLPGSDGEPELAEIVYPSQVVRQMCWDFLRDGLQTAVGIDHQEVTETGIVSPQGEYAVVVENFTAPVCYEMRGRHITQGSWVQTYQFTDDDVWDSVLRGERRAPSLTAPLSDVTLTLIEGENA